MSVASSKGLAGIRRSRLLTGLAAQQIGVQAGQNLGWRQVKNRGPAITWMITAESETCVPNIQKVSSQVLLMGSSQVSA